MKTLTIAIFVLMVVAQWFIPLRMVVRQESVMTNGKTFRLKTQPIDPSDPFRGKYIVLRFKAEEYKIDTALHWKAGETAYVTLEEDSAGFARIDNMTRIPPENTVDYIRARTAFVYDNGWTRLEFPFDRFYVEESKASEAEQAYWQAAADTTQVTYAEVSVHRGNAALQDVKINGKSIVTIVDEINRAREDEDDEAQ